jgi:hypothetical protein
VISELQLAGGWGASRMLLRRMDDREAFLPCVISSCHRLTGRRSRIRRVCRREIRAAPKPWIRLCPSSARSNRRAARGSSPRPAD